jgi:hypothetical protein
VLVEGAHQVHITNDANHIAALQGCENIAICGQLRNNIAIT